MVLSLFQVILTGFQWGIVLTLNIALMLKLRSIWSRQRELKEAMSHKRSMAAAAAAPQNKERRFSHLINVTTISHLLVKYTGPGKRNFTRTSLHDTFFVPTPLDPQAP